MTQETMTANERRLLGALAWMCNQYLTDGDSMDHQCMGAGERAIALLAEYGFVNDVMRRATWTDKGQKLLDEDWV